ncbi:hypothetical protein AMTRI_Chr03g46830 [Amborella trichopoda]
MYAMSYNRPDIVFALGILSRYSRNPGQGHWNAIYRILRYLKGTIDYVLHYVGDSSILEGYSDANWITDFEESRSTSGWIFTYGGGAVAWGSKK